MIKETSTQKVYMNIPTDLINTVISVEQDDGQMIKIEGQKAIKIICSRMKWEGKRLLRIINPRNIDCLFKLTTSDPKD